MKLLAIRENSKRTVGAVVLKRNEAHRVPQSECGQLSHNSDEADMEYDLITTLLLYAAIGIPAGMIAGAFGVGGGIVVVPAVLLSLEISGVEPELATRMAIGTSLATIVATASASVFQFVRARSVAYEDLLYAAPTVAIGAIVGGSLVVFLPGLLLRVAFGSMLVYQGLKILKESYAPMKEYRSISKPVAAGMTLVGGMGAASMGIGGGILVSPIMRMRGHSPKLCVGTAACTTLVVAVMGTTSLLVSSGASEQLLPMSTGFVYWPAAIGVALSSVIAATLCARWAVRVSDSIMQRVLASAFVLCGGWMLLSSVVEWALT